MPAQQVFYIGVSIASRKSEFYITVLDSTPKLIQSSEIVIEDLISFILDQSRSVIVTCFPSRPNIGLMDDPGFRTSIRLNPESRKFRDLRYCEYQLLQERIRTHRTPKDFQKAPKWMQQGFILARTLEEMGIPSFPAHDAKHQWAETDVEASYQRLLGQRLIRKNTLEGQIQRQLILYDLRLPTPDPMIFFQEITRYRIRTGIFPYNKLLKQHEMGALLAAYIAWLIGKQPAQVDQLGNPDEGLLTLPLIIKN